jgi:hypothetical protein
MQGFGGGSYPRIAYLLTLIGGLLIILGAIYNVYIGALVAGYFGAYAYSGFYSGFLIIYLVFGVIALILGLLVLIGAMKLRSSPQTAKTWGVLILVFALISFVGDGFYIGSVLALVGGILALIWTPGAPMGQPAWGQPGQAQWGQPQQATWGQPTAPPMAGKMCASCGSPNASGAQYCAKCGAALPP